MQFLSFFRGEILQLGCKKLSFTTLAHLLERKRRRKCVRWALIDGWKMTLAHIFTVVFLLRAVNKFKKFAANEFES